MNKKEAVDFMIKEIEEIEKDRIAAQFSVDDIKKKDTAAESILKILKKLEIKDENQ